MYNMHVPGASVRLGRTGDGFERAARRIADRSNGAGPTPGHRSAVIARPTAARIDAAATALRAPGHALGVDERAYFEPLIGHDFSSVRIHDDNKAHNAARGIRARAYTLGNDIAFSRGACTTETPEGRQLMAHELAHVAQQSRRSARIIQRQDEETATPQNDTAGESQGVTFTLNDLLVYPLIVDLWNDIVRHRVSEEVLNEIRLRGFEDSALWNAVLAIPFAASQIPGNASFGDFLEGWAENAEELQKLAGGSSFVLDLVSAFAGVNIERYLASDQFLGRLQAHAASVTTVLVVAQAILSTVAGASESAAEVGEFEPSQWEQQTGLVRGLLDIVFKKHFTAPDFFNVGPLKLSTHPAFAAGPAAGGPPPSGLTFEHAEGEGDDQGGLRLRTGLTLNLREIANTLRDEGASDSETADFRGWQGSLWFNYDLTDPTRLQREMGQVSESSFRTGTIFGGGGFLGLLEGGARYGENADEARELTRWFLRGGFGYSGRRNEVLQRIGFDATYLNWQDRDVLAPVPSPDRDAGGGSATRLRPSTSLRFDVNEDHRFTAGAAFGFVTGTHESFGLSDFRADLSYIYQGDRSADQLPQFRIDLAASVSRLDWWNPDSPLLTGLEARAQFDRFFLGGRVNFGAGDITEDRAALLAPGPDDRLRARVPTSVLFTGGIRLGAGAGDRP